MPGEHGEREVAMVGEEHVLTSMPFPEYLQVISCEPSGRCIPHDLVILIPAPDRMPVQYNYDLMRPSATHGLRRIRLYLQVLGKDTKDSEASLVPMQ